MERRDKMRKICLQFLIFIGVLISGMSMTACQKSKQQNIAEQFIKTQINCSTYITSEGDEEVLKEIFLEFFTEEAYQQYLDEAVGYFYPQLFYLLNADKSRIHKVKCNKKVKTSDGMNRYEFEVSYSLMNLDENQKKAKDTIKLKDYLQITIDENNKINNVVILNTSDIIKKLFLDIKVQ